MFFEVGDKDAFLRGASFNYDKYRLAAPTRNWGDWPIRAMWRCLGMGAILIIIGAIVTHFGGK